MRLNDLSVLLTSVSGFVVAVLRCGSQGNVAQRIDDRGQKRGIVGVYPNTYYATACLATFSVALQESSGGALAIGLVFPSADHLDLHVG